MHQTPKGVLEGKTYLSYFLGAIDLQVVLGKLCLTNEINNSLPQAGLVELEVFIKSGCGLLEVPCEGANGCDPPLKPLEGDKLVSLFKFSTKK